MPLKQLRRIRWAVRSTLVLGVAASVVANVLHARDNPISQAIAAWPPLALLLTVELISRVPVHRRSLAAARLFATATIAGIAAWVSYWHMVGVAARYGETGASPYLLPLSVDGLIVVASICLVELGSRIAVETAAATPHTAAATTPARTGDPVRTSSLKGTSGPSGIAATTGSPGSNGTATGSPGANDIPSTAGSPSTALLPGTAGISGTANGHVPPDPVIAGPGRPTATTFRTGAGARVPVDGDPDRLGRAALRTDPDGQVAADGTGRGQPVNGMAPLFRAPPVEETTPATGDADPDVVPGRSSEDDGRTSAYGETTAEPHIAAARGEHLDGDHVNAVLDRPTRVNGTRAIPAQSRTPDGASGRVLASAVLDEVAAHLKAARPADGPAPVAARATRTTAARQRTTGSLLTSAARRTGTTPGTNGGINGTESTHSGPDTDPATAGNGRTTETATGPGNGTGTELGNRPGNRPDVPPDPAERLAGQPGAAPARRPRRSAAETAALADQIQADHPDATDEEVAAHLGITPRRLRDVRRDARQLT